MLRRLDLLLSMFLVGCATSANERVPPEVAPKRVPTATASPTPQPAVAGGPFDFSGKDPRPDAGAPGQPPEFYNVIGPPIAPIQ